MNLKQVIESSDTKSGKIFDLTIQFLIIYSLITFSISTLPNLSEGTLTFLFISQVITVSIFTIEYIFRIFVADKKMSYILSFYGLIDLLAILPFYLSFAVDLRSLRILRLLRLFRLLKIVRYSNALKRYRIAFKEIKEELVIFFTTTCFLIYISGVGIYYFENNIQPEAFSSIFHSLWWAVATLTTVGYGEIYPITIGGKVFTFIILMIGLGVVAIPAGLLASALQDANGRIDSENVQI
ncbi:MAG: ion transporter [Balneolaceae bacterium]